MSDKLFFVEFGIAGSQPNIFSPNISGVKPTHIIANDYNEAEIKAQIYLETELLKVNDNVLDTDGSLKQAIINKEAITITSIRLITDNIIK